MIHSNVADAEEQPKVDRDNPKNSSEPAKGKRESCLAQ
jgi:hypothetical protein